MWLINVDDWMVEKCENIEKKESDIKKTNQWRREAQWILWPGWNGLSFVGFILEDRSRPIDQGLRWVAYVKGLELEDRNTVSIRSLRTMMVVLQEGWQTER